MLQLNERMKLASGNRHNDCPVGNQCDDADYEACVEAGGMGYKLDGVENPFGDESMDCL